MEIGTAESLRYFDHDRMPDMEETTREHHDCTIEAGYSSWQENNEMLKLS